MTNVRCMDQPETDLPMDRQQDLAGRREQAGQPGDGLGAQESTSMSGAVMPTEQHADAHENAAQDAGWARLSSPDGQVDLGRGRLQMWYEVPGSKNGVRHAQLSSYTPGSVEPRRGDTVAVVPEHDAEQYIATITEYTAVPEGGSIVVLDWPSNEMPASLRELGGE